MSRYTFTFKKDDIFVEFYTADRDVVEKQFQIWVADADDYANNRPRKGISKSNPSSTQDKEEKSEKNLPAPAVKEEIKKAAKIAEEDPQIKEVEQTVEEPQVFDKASSLLKTINSIQEGEEKGNTGNQPLEMADFDTLLENTMENPALNPNFEPNKNQDPIFLNLIKSKNTTDKFHYLMITSYYLSEFEKLERFSIKQINTKLMQNLSEVIDHITLQEAINQNLLEVLPDLTGTSEVAEYRLTRAGEEFFARI